MASGNTVLLPGLSLTLAPRPGTVARPVSPDKTDFSNWIRLRAALAQPSTDGPVVDVGAINALAKRFTLAALAQASKGITAENQRRKDEALAKATLLVAVEELIATFQTEHPEDARLVWTEYLKALEQNKPQIDFIQKEIAESKARIAQLTPPKQAAKQKPTAKASKKALSALQPKTP